VLAAADIIEWFADEGRRVYGRIVPRAQPGGAQMVLKDPVGPVAAFTPWNFPINQIVRKLGARLATGCSFLSRRRRRRPARPALLIGFVDAGLPPGRRAWCSATRPRSPAT
jgi:succinate-semialdehyde dehydrogenase/glutarate-semialdehyde dehydrogenase